MAANVIPGHAAGYTATGSVWTMRIAGVRLGAPVARLLSEILETEGYPATAGKIEEPPGEQAIRRVREAAEAQPDRIAQQVRAWMHED